VELLASMLMNSDVLSFLSEYHGSREQGKLAFSKPSILSASLRIYFGILPGSLPFHDGAVCSQKRSARQSNIVSVPTGGAGHTGSNERADGHFLCRSDMPAP